MIRKIWRRLNQAYAWFMGYFWLPCPRCGEMFGGHEKHGDSPYSVPNKDGGHWIVCKKHKAPKGTLYFISHYDEKYSQAVDKHGHVLARIDWTDPK